MVERLVANEKVEGSTPFARSIPNAISTQSQQTQNQERLMTNIGILGYLKIIMKLMYFLTRKIQT